MKLWGFVVGAACGAVAARLVAPQVLGTSLGVGDLVPRGKSLLEVVRTAVDRAVAEGRRTAEDQRRALQSQITTQAARE